MSATENLAGAPPVFPQGKLVVLKYDLDFKITYANEAFAELLGVPRESLIGTPIREIAHPEVPAELLADVRSTTSSGRPWMGMAKLRIPGTGQPMWTQSLIMPVLKGDKTLGYMSIRSPVSEERGRQEEALYAAMRAGKAKYRNYDMPHRKSVSSAALIMLLGCLIALFGVAGVWLGAQSGLSGGSLVALLVLLGGGALVGLVSLGLLWRRAVLEPRDVLAHFRRIAEGDLTGVLPVGRNDESGRVMEALMYMQGRLKVMLDEIRLAARLTDEENSALRQEVEALKRVAQGQRDYILSVSAASEQNSTAVHDVANSAKFSAGAADSALNLVANGRNNINRTVSAARETLHTVEAVNDVMSSLNKSILSIGSVSQEIREISDQTNLLALNAAIEAARAGEVGRGFAVVADEVRKLAERTAHCTGSIGGLVDEIRKVSSRVSDDMTHAVGQVGEASNHASDSLQVMEQIENDSCRVAQLAAQIAQASAEHSVATEQIANDMEQISGLVQESLNSIEQVEGVVGQVHENVRQLKELVSFFRTAA